MVMEEKVEKRMLIVDADRCTGCSICELVCSMAKHGVYNPKKSYIRVLRNWEMDVNIVALDLHCDFCNECVAWCPARAIRFERAEDAAMLRKKNPLGIFPAPLLSSE
jgi:carbon-monoxide dehydrogenase iron sulfur subunit